MIASLFSVDQQGGMGLDGSMPWPLDPEDMRWFRELTKGQVVIMGRRTWDDPLMPKPLPGRTCVVVTTRAIDGVETINGDVIAGVLDAQRRYADKNIFIIGGAGLLAETRVLCEQAHIALRSGIADTDVRMDLRKYLQGFQMIWSRQTTACPDITFRTYKNQDAFTWNNTSTL